MTEAYDDALLRFLTLMRKQLRANIGKGERPGWQKMSANEALLEAYCRLAKLQAAVRKDDGFGMQEYSADVALMSMMVLDICGALAWVRAEPAANPLDALVNQILNRRATVEQWMFDAASGKRPMPAPDELRNWALHLGTPGEPSCAAAALGRLLEASDNYLAASSGTEAYQKLNAARADAHAVLRGGASAPDGGDHR